MSRIPVVVVDDEKVDRYIVKRKLAKFDDFGEVLEASTGVDFLESFFNGHGSGNFKDQPLLVLMDVNMPRMNGFETIEELQKRMAGGHGPESIVIMMFTSSNNPDDRAKAEMLPTVKGYILKPLDDDGVLKIREIYHS
ncbi:MAG: response regulator [Paracoccaceae bacterium]